MSRGWGLRQRAVFGQLARRLVFPLPAPGWGRITEQIEDQHSAEAVATRRAARVLAQQGYIEVTRGYRVCRYLDAFETERLVVVARLPLEWPGPYSPPQDRTVTWFYARYLGLVFASLDRRRDTPRREHLAATAGAERRAREMLDELPTALRGRSVDEWAPGFARWVVAEGLMPEVRAHHGGFDLASNTLSGVLQENPQYILGHVLGPVPKSPTPSYERWRELVDDAVSQDES